MMVLSVKTVEGSVLRNSLYDPPSTAFLLWKTETRVQSLAMTQTSCYSSSIFLSLIHQSFVHTKKHMQHAKMRRRAKNVKMSFLGLFAIFGPSAVPSCTVMMVSKFWNDSPDRQFPVSTVKPYFDRAYRQTVLHSPDHSYRKKLLENLLFKDFLLALEKDNAMQEHSNQGANDS
jgi:hypothetical protein